MALSGPYNDLRDGAGEFIYADYVRVFRALINDYNEVRQRLWGPTHLNLRGEGAAGDGTTNDTLDLLSAWNKATRFDQGFFDADSNSFYRLKGPGIELPPGNYLTTGGLTLDPVTQASEFVIEGAGQESTRITNTADTYLFDFPSNAPLDKFTIRGLQVKGGKGLLAHRYTGLNVRARLIVEDVILKDYTECGIGTLASDMPYWSITRCIFDGLFDTDHYPATGVLLSGLTDACVIEDCDFRRNRYGIKVIGSGGPNMHISRCDFLRFQGLGTRTENSHAVWIVPKAATHVTAGTGLTISHSKFGNENLIAGDRHILYADEDTLSGADAFTRVHSEAASTGRINGHLVHHNAFYGNANAQPPLVYSTTPTLLGCSYDHNVVHGSPPAYAIEFRDAGVGPGATSIVGPLFRELAFVSMLASNRTATLVRVDPCNLFQDAA